MLTRRLPRAASICATNFDAHRSRMRVEVRPAEAGEIGGVGLNQRLVEWAVLRRGRLVALPMGMRPNVVRQRHR